jgi:hypothetical protein
VQKYLRISIISIYCGFFSGCTSEQLYATGQAYQRNQCQQLPDQDARKQCLSKTNSSYDDYKKEKDSGTQ